MGCSESKEELHLRDDYHRMLKNTDVVTAMESVQIDIRDAGLRFYRVFAQMDTDGSRSIDLDEFHSFLKLPRTRLSDQVFSALGHQNASRDVTFDDFILNMWNFCSMSSDDIRDAIFHLYDDDHSGTLDAAECESLFRLLYNTSDLSPAVRRVVKDVDVNGDGLLDTAEFAVLCGKNKSLLRPVFDIQRKTQQKCLGESYWASVKKKRARVLNGEKDVFALVNQRRTQHANEPPSENVSSHAPSGTPSDPRPPIRRASDVIAAMQAKKEHEAFEAWVRTQQQEHPVVDQYLKSYCEVFVTKNHLTATRTRHKSADNSGPDTIQLTTDLRHNLAVSEKRLEEAKSKLEAYWSEEEAAVRNARHETVHAAMKVLSPQTLSKYADKKDGASAVGTYLQKKLDAATAEVHAQFQQRWEMLDKASHLLAERSLAAAPSPAERMQDKKAADRRHTTPNTKPPSRVVPVAPQSETWTEHFDTTHNRAYYVSSLGTSSWERPEGYFAT